MKRRRQSAHEWANEPKGERASEAQIAALKRRGLDEKHLRGISRSFASRLLDKPTPKQTALLRRNGLWREGMTFAEARDAIDGIARTWNR